MSRPLSTLALFALALPAALADTIQLSDGRVLDGVTIQREGLVKTVYTKDRKEQEIDSESILAVRFDRMPQLVDRAESAVRDELYEDAIYDLEQYLVGVQDNPPRQHPWAPAYAMFRLVELHSIMGSWDKAAAAADRVLAGASDSRYAPHAYLRKAQAQAAAGKASAGLETLAALRAFANAKGLSQRWRLEADFGIAQLDEKLTGEARRKRFDEISAAATEFPVVRNRSEVALAESYLEAKQLDKAEEVFRGVTEDPRADAATLAAAYTGLGECLFGRWSKTPEPKLLDEALMAFMRVVVVYPDEARYVPKAMFYAGRVYDNAEHPEAKERAQKLYQRTYFTFRGSRWAEEARAFIRRS